MKTRYNTYPILHELISSVLEMGCLLAGRSTQQAHSLNIIFELVGSDLNTRNRLIASPAAIPSHKTDL